MPPLDFALPATLDTILLMDFVNLLLLLKSLMPDVLSGTQLITFVRLVLRTRSLITMESVCLLVISAENMTMLEPALDAGKDMTLLTEPVFSHLPTLLAPQ
jgi:hypothetical protein